MQNIHPEKLFDALADPTRLAVVGLLAERPYRSGELAKATASDPARMSRHLKVLLEAGILVDERVAHDARARIFHLRPDAFDPIESWLEHLQTLWDAQLHAFKQRVEKEKPS